MSSSFIPPPIQLSRATAVDNGVPDRGPLGGPPALQRQNGQSGNYGQEISNLNLGSVLPPNQNTNPMFSWPPATNPSAPPASDLSSSAPSVFSSSASSNAGSSSSNPFHLPTTSSNNPLPGPPQLYGTGHTKYKPILKASSEKGQNYEALWSICCMEQYPDRSPDELRFDDMQLFAGIQPNYASANSSAFSLPSSNSFGNSFTAGFSTAPAASTSTSSLFSTGPFSSSNNLFQSNPFQPASAPAQNNPLGFSGGLTGGNASTPFSSFFNTSSSSFSQPQQQQQQNSFLSSNAQTQPNNSFFNNFFQNTNQQPNSFFRTNSSGNSFFNTSNPFNPQSSTGGGGAGSGNFFQNSGLKFDFSNVLSNAFPHQNNPQPQWTSFQQAGSFAANTPQANAFTFGSNYSFQNAFNAINQQPNYLFMTDNFVQKVATVDNDPFNLTEIKKQSKSPETNKRQQSTPTNSPSAAQQQQQQQPSATTKTSNAEGPQTPQKSQSTGSAPSSAEREKDRERSSVEEFQLPALTRSLPGSPSAAWKTSAGGAAAEYELRKSASAALTHSPLLQSSRKAQFLSNSSDRGTNGVSLLSGPRRSLTFSPPMIGMSAAAVTASPSVNPSQSGGSGTSSMPSSPLHHSVLAPTRSSLFHPKKSSTLLFPASGPRRTVSGTTTSPNKTGHRGIEQLEIF